jgi:outer membrane protein
MGAGLCLMAQDQALPDNLWLKTQGWEGLKLHVGAMTLRLPPYPGSDEQRTVPFPVFNGEYQHRLEFGASRFGVGGGFNYKAFVSGPWSIGFGGEGVEARHEAHADGLAGMGDRPIGLFLTWTTEYHEGPFFVAGVIRQGLRDGKGIGAVTRAAVVLPFGRRWILETRVSANFYDHTTMMYEFGIDEGQAARRSALLAAGDRRLRPGEDRVFRPTGGSAMLQVSSALGFALDAHWRLGLTVLRQEVEGDARHSPLVRQPGGWGTILGFSYQL